MLGLAMLLIYETLALLLRKHDDCHPAKTKTCGSFASSCRLVTRLSSSDATGPRRPSDIDWIEPGIATFDLPDHPLYLQTDGSHSDELSRVAGIPACWDFKLGSITGGLLTVGLTVPSFSETAEMVGYLLALDRMFWMKATSYK